ncbi:hypothetical protein MKW92_014343 [Papaver armeniacum]|nr:hypothetical protein MKW92_014343 [Papaver armeniacum]
MESTGDENSCYHPNSASVGCLGIGDSALYQGFWIFAEALENIKDFQQNFKAVDTDLLLASLPKSGTVWLKALVFAIVNRTHHPILSTSQNHPLFTVSPHDLVPFVDFKHVYPDCSLLDFTKSSSHNHDDSACRLIATHIPYTSLPDSVIDRAINCKIVYICRNPQDTFISTWHFINKMRTLPESKVLFLKYEDLKKEPEPQLKKLAEFLGHSFSMEEESQGVIKEILSLCSFQHMKNLDVNKSGKILSNSIANKDIFRKGEVGDWKNYLTPKMVERLDRLMEEKLCGSRTDIPKLHLLIYLSFIHDPLSYVL